jgi:UDP-N-acetylmuramoyl-tripeptide--D-alanyl-D-alanine ligase
MSFTLNTGHEKARCTAKILGLHNASNIAAAALAALNMGLTLEEIARGISKIEPVPHRLQLINSGTGITVIDDAFNSNPVGSRMALETLALFSGRKIVITPGMVDLGEEEYRLNRGFGEKIAEVCDYAILVGRNRAKPIIEGL